MNIAVVGLGLIGGSICKVLKANTFHHIMGIDNDKNTVKKALEQGAIDEEITEDRLSDAGLTIVALYPLAIVDFVKKKRGQVPQRLHCYGYMRHKRIYREKLHPYSGREGRYFYRYPPYGGDGAFGV